MRRLFRALAGLPLAAAMLYLPGPENALGQTPVRPPLGIEPATAAGQNLPPSGGRYAGVLPPQPRPHSPYEVTAKAPGGPWMVLAANYTCQDAEYLATQVVEYLRRHGEFAYLWNFADQQRRKQEEEYNKLMQSNRNVPYRRRITRIQEQCGVLIGGYPKDTAANAQLKRIKKLTPPVVRDRKGQVVQDFIFAGMEGKQHTTGKTVAQTYDRVPLSPFARAFVIWNPALPRPRVDQTAAVDPAWKRLNSAEEYNLLKCRKNYTLVIKFLEGPGVLQDNAMPSNSGFMAKLFGEDKHKLLYATAVQAHSLADMLNKSDAIGKLCEQYHLPRQRAYVLHMRHGSLVTVGGFDSLDDKNLKAMQFRLSGMRLNAIQGGDPSTADALQTFTQPLPMKVPKP